MVKVAIIENEEKDARSLEEMVKKYTSENKGEEVSFTIFESGNSFLSSFQKGDYDILFMDIEMPGMNGMETSRRLREVDSSVILIFVTNLSQYAIQGFSVSALDFLVKPVLYSHLVQVLNRTKKILFQRKNHFLTLSSKEKTIILDISKIRYIEVFNHTLVFHTTEGNHKITGSLAKIEEKLSRLGFSRCNSCYLVNLKYVTSLNSTEVTLDNNEVLRMSQAKRKTFREDLVQYLAMEA